MCTSVVCAPVWCVQSIRQDLCRLPVLIMNLNPIVERLINIFTEFGSGHGLSLKLFYQEGEVKYFLTNLPPRNQEKKRKKITKQTSTRIYKMKLPPYPNENADEAHPKE